MNTPVIHPEKMVVVHDYFGIRGGGERVALSLASNFDATLMFGYRTSETFDADMFSADIRDLGLPSMFQKPGLRAAALAMRFRSSRREVRQYPTRIFSGVSAPFAAPKAGSGRNIYYCHTPPRFLYDQKDHFARVVRGSPARTYALERFRKAYEAAFGRMDVVVANSQTVRERIQTFLGRDAVVVYPPCDTHAYKWLGQDPFYLSTARLSPLKRVDRIVDAFIRMPDKHLVVASQGDDFEMLKRRAADAPNITFLGWVGEERLRILIGKAIATLYVPVDEDFGISPVESMAAGKPVIGVAEGGLRETIVPGETGLLLNPAFDVNQLVEAVEAMTPGRALTMRSACEARSILFSESRFITGMNAAVGK
ncbi:glycosyltransferase [Mesorhizobium australicum]|uniref:glycosyltransferase n=1 Tax=Mesorhizobium australicum TaxID=536018 RepID=UPI003339B941